MISFVVPVYNEERLIGATLLALRDAATASGEPYEILVVDDASTDRTASIAAFQAGVVGGGAPIWFDGRRSGPRGAGEGRIGMSLEPPARL